MNNNRDELKRMVREILLSELKKRRQDESDTPDNSLSIKDPLRNIKAIKKYYGQSNKLD